MHLLDEIIPDGRIDGIWRQILDVFRGGILADWFVVRRTIAISSNRKFIARQQSPSP